MIKTLPDIESFEKNIARMYEQIQGRESGLFEMYYDCEKLGMSGDEIEALYYHLKRSDMVERGECSLLRISDYGHMMMNGDIRQAYAPM